MGGNQTAEPMSTFDPLQTFVGVSLLIRSGVGSSIAHERAVCPAATRKNIGTRSVSNLAVPWVRSDRNRTGSAKDRAMNSESSGELVICPKQGKTGEKRHANHPQISYCHLDSGCFTLRS